MRIVVIQLNYVVVPSKIVGDLPLKGGTRESSPEDLATLDHQLIRFWNPSVKVQVASLFGIGL